VVAVDHTDAAAVTVFPDGEARYYDPERFGIPSDVVPSKTLVNDRMFPVWVADQRYVYDTLEIWESNDPLLGASSTWGASARSGIPSAAPRRWKSAWSTRAVAAPQISTVGCTARPKHVLPTTALPDEFRRQRQRPGSGRALESLIRRATGPAYWLELPNSSHLSFTFTQLLSPLLPPAGFDPRAGLLVVDTYLRAFFDTHLRGTDAPPLGRRPAIRTSAG
jgi:hypothetical protein